MQGSNRDPTTMPDLRALPHPPTLSATGGAGFDTLVVGAGFAGCVLAERLASQNGQRVLVNDKPPHIGGKAYERHEDAGVLVHAYGPHIVHTHSADVFASLSQFTAWRPYQHGVLVSVDGQLVPMPINLDTVNRLYCLQLTAFQMDEFLASVAEKTESVCNSEDVVVNRVGRDLYNKFFRGCTRKQWALDPSDLDASVTARVPARPNRDDRYFTDTHQAMPLHGYTCMFERMLAHPRIQAMLNTATWPRCCRGGTWSTAGRSTPSSAAATAACPTAAWTSSLSRCSRPCPARFAATRPTPRSARTSTSSAGWPATSSTTGTRWWGRRWLPKAAGGSAGGAGGGGGLGAPTLKLRRALG